MAASARIRFKVGEVLNGGVYFAGDELVLPVDDAQVLVDAGKAEFVPTAPTPSKPVPPEDVKK